MAKRGKNKQGRCNLRQVSYALFCTTDGHLPLFYDVYEGNRNDAKEFPQVLERFQRWLKERAASTWSATKPTLIFDQGNNSTDNFALIDTLELPYVGSLKLDEHADLATVSDRDPRWQPATEPALEGTKSWRIQQGVYGKERTLVMTYNPNLYESQWATVQNDLAQALSQLACVQRNLQDRATGILKGGSAPTVESVKRKCDQILHRQHLRQLCSDHRHAQPGGRAAVELQSRCQCAGEVKGYLPGQDAAGYRSPALDRRASHPGLSEPVCDRGNLSRDERPTHWATYCTFSPTAPLKPR